MNSLVILATSTIPGTVASTKGRGTTMVPDTRAQVSLTEAVGTPGISNVQGRPGL
jgi:hypothetical protein